MALHKGEGWAIGNLDDLGEGSGFRKIRRELDVSEMGVNAIVQPPGMDPGFHLHERQEEVYFVHEGAVEIEFGDGTKHHLDAGGLARVAAATPRKVTAVGDDAAVYVVFGAQGGYVGRDGQQWNAD